jgi:hypothetical protein
MVLVFAEPGDTHLRKKFTPEAKNFWAWLFHTQLKAAVSTNKSPGRLHIHSKKQLQTLLDAHKYIRKPCRQTELAGLPDCYYFDSFSRPWCMG